MTDVPAIQLIANLVIQRHDGRVLLVRYDPDGEVDQPDADARWWLPAHELEPYQHPDQAARIAVDQIGGLQVDELTLNRIQSFRGRRGWHISFDYQVRAAGEPGTSLPADWYTIDDLPPTMHGNWERETIDAVVTR
jgi:ADP-ribose pyrophosphatase YjhB (NUDIX family)